jgi:hypothetical protein
MLCAATKHTEHTCAWFLGPVELRVNKQKENESFSQLLLTARTRFTFTSVSDCTGPATGLYLLPLGNLSTAKPPAPSPGTIFTTAQVLLSVAEPAGLLAGETLDAVNSRGQNLSGANVVQGLTVTVRLPASRPATLRAAANLDNSTG